MTDDHTKQPILKDKMGQEIKEGMWVIKPWEGTFDVGRVVKVTESTFTYTRKNWQGKEVTSVCKVPWRCLVVPEILANYWDILK